MPTLLHLDSSADLTGSVSRVLTAEFAAAWQGISSSHTVVRRDLHTDALPHLPTNLLHWAPFLREGQSVPAAAEQLQVELIQELAAVDAVVIGAPLYNWSMPSTLKAWIDYIQVGGTTSSYSGSAQLFAGKPVLVVSSRGDQYGPGSGNEGTDHEIPALRQVLGVALGMDFSYVVAELTLASTIPAMASLIGKSEESLAAARASLSDVLAGWQ